MVLIWTISKNSTNYWKNTGIKSKIVGFSKKLKKLNKGVLGNFWKPYRVNRCHMSILTTLRISTLIRIHFRWPKRHGIGYCSQWAWICFWWKKIRYKNSKIEVWIIWTKQILMTIWFRSRLLRTLLKWMKKRSHCNLVRILKFSRSQTASNLPSTNLAQLQIFHK